MLGEIYAYASLAIWLTPLMLCFAARRCRKLAVHDRHKEMFTITIGAFGIYLAIQLMFLANPPIFPAAILSLTMLVFVVNAYKMNNFELSAAIMAVIGGLSLIAAYPVINLREGYDGSTAMRKRATNQRSEFITKMSSLAAKDETEYPAGELKSGHPLIAAHPELSENLNVLYAPSPLWHSFFTNMYIKRRLPPPNYPGGKLADAMKNLPDWQWQGSKKSAN